MTDETLLFRQVHPSWVQEGRVTSQAFKPTPKDENLLSCYDGDLIACDASWKHYTEQLQLLSIGVYAVSVDECKQLELPAKPDPARFPEHAVVDFSGCERRPAEKKAKELRSRAVQRGWQYQPPTEQD